MTTTVPPIPKRPDLPRTSWQSRCVHCGDPLAAERSTRAYCSNRCRQAAYRLRRRAQRETDELTALRAEVADLRQQCQDLDAACADAEHWGRQLESMLHVYEHAAEAERKRAQFWATESQTWFNHAEEAWEAVISPQSEEQRALAARVRREQGEATEDLLDALEEAGLNRSWEWAGFVMACMVLLRGEPYPVDEYGVSEAMFDQVITDARGDAKANPNALGPNWARPACPECGKPDAYRIVPREGETPVRAYRSFAREIARQAKP